MLKWAVGGHHQARAEPPCCTAIRRPPFKRAKRANNTTVYDKENENGSGSRDSSVYMRLEAVPVALRDLSNHQTPPTDIRLSPKVKRPRTCSSPPKLEVEKKVKEERRKLPCAVDGHGQTRVCLDTDRPLFQIEYTPGARRVPRSPTMDDHIYFLDHTASPVELDHKEIPLEQKKKDIILSTPGRLVLQDTIACDSTPRTAGVSPLARRFAFLELSRTAAGSDIFDSPDETPIKPRRSYLSTTATIPMPLLPPTLPECETLKAWVEANRHLDTTPIKPPSDTSTRSGLPFRKPTGSTVSEASSAKTFIVKDDSPRSRITNPTNHDRNSVSCESLFKSPIFEGGMDDVKVKSILVNRYSSLPSISETGLGVDTSRKRRGVIFNDTTFTLNTPPSDEERASSSAWSVDACAPSTLKRQRVVRRRKGRRKHPISELSGGRRLGLTLPDGIPSPPSPPDLALPLRSPTWGSAKLSDSLTPAQTSTSTRMDYEADSSSTGSSLTMSPIGTETDSAGSRRCLFSSPLGERLSRRGNSFTPRSGELELSMLCKNSLLTIHVIRGKNLQALSGLCNAYVKVCLVGCGSYHRTCVKKDSSNPRFDQSFSFQLRDEDMDRRVLVSAWHRDRSNRKSEFLGCMSFAVRNVLKKDIQGRYRLLSQGSGRLGHLPAISNGQANSADVMANQSESSVEELVSVDESDVPPTPEAGKERKRLNSTRKDYGKVIEDYIFLRYLELDPATDEQEAGGTSSGASRRGRTPFTTTRTLRRQPGNSFGFSIAWTHPPRVERVESGLPADQAGLRPGDYIIFVEKSNVVTMKEEQILEIIKSCGNQIILESYRKAPNSGGRPLSHPGAVAVSPRACSAANACSTAPCSANACSTAACSAATTTASLDVSKKRLHFPHVTFTSEGQLTSQEDARRRCLCQLVEKEQEFAVAMQFGMLRFLQPLAERRDLISTNEHALLFQNAQELLRLSEDILELFMQDEALWNCVGRIYLKKLNLYMNGYRRYWVGLKKAHKQLVEKSTQSGFNKFVTEPPVPRRRPDLVTFLHRPVQHYREVLKQLQLTLHSTKNKNDDHQALNKVVNEMQAHYREMAGESGLMEPDCEGRPLLSLPDLESRLVFTRCKPFTLANSQRQWLLGGDLTRIEGRSHRPYWALLFTDLLVLAKVSRDRVLFVTEEPLHLTSIAHCIFSVRKKDTEFRLVIRERCSGEGEDSPAAGQGVCLAELRNQKGPRRRTVAFRAPNPELKALWQNLIQRQILYLSLDRGGTPASSPLDSPDPMTADSLDSICPKRDQEARLADLIEQRCKQLGKAGLSRGSALHLSQWMRGELGNSQLLVTSQLHNTSPIDHLTDTQIDQLEPPQPQETWNSNTLRLRHQDQVRSPQANSQEDFPLSDASIKSTDESQRTVKSGGGESPERTVAVCRKCQKTCMVGTSRSVDLSEVQGWADWPSDPFQPLPEIAIQPPSPRPPSQTTSWHDLPTTINSDSKPSSCVYNGEGEDESEGEDLEEPPYRSLSPCGLKRYGTLSSLEQLQDNQQDNLTNQTQDCSSSQFEYVSQSIRGWTMKAGSYVVEKMSFFDTATHDSPNTTFIDRYIRRELRAADELTCTSTTLAGEEECETSGGTSENDIWGTPTSGSLPSPSAEGGEESEDSSSTGEGEAALLEAVLGGGGLLSGFTSGRPWAGSRPPTRRRLEPLPEDEEETSSSTSTPDLSEATNSCLIDQGSKSEGGGRGASRSASSTPRFLDKLKLRRSQSADSRPNKPKRFLEFLRSSKSEEETSSSRGRQCLLRLFSRDSSQDDIPTSLPSATQQLINKQEKPMERRFWKQLYKRRSGGNLTKHLAQGT